MILFNHQLSLMTEALSFEGLIKSHPLNQNKINKRIIQEFITKVLMIMILLHPKD